MIFQKCFDYLIESIFVEFGERNLVGIQMGTKFAPLLADLCFYSNEAKFFHYEWVEPYGISVSQPVVDILLVIHQ